MVRPSGKAQRGYGSAGGEGMRLGCEVKAQTFNKDQRKECGSRARVGLGQR